MKGPGGRAIDGDYEVTEVSPNRQIKFQVVAGPARPTGTYQFEPSGSGTMVKFILDFQPTGIARPMDPIISKTMQQEVGMLTNLKTTMETQNM